MSKKVLMVLAPRNFRDEEFFEPKEVMENAGIAVFTASSSGRIAESSAGKNAKVNMKLTEVKVSDYDAIVFVGGSGAAIYFNDTHALNLAKEFYSAGKVVAAICIAPTILVNAGLLDGKRATSLPSEEKKIAAVGTYTGTEVEIDDRIVTGKRPSAAKEFGRAIVNAINRRR